MPPIYADIEIYLLCMSSKLKNMVNMKWNTTHIWILTMNINLKWIMFRVSATRNLCDAIDFIDFGSIYLLSIYHCVTGQFKYMTIITIVYFKVMQFNSVQFIVIDFDNEQN